MTASHRSAAEIEASIEAQQAQISDTLEALEHNLAPRNILDQGFTMVRDTVKENAGKLVDTISRDPLPLGVIGIGIGWLLLSATAPRWRDNPQAAAVRRRLDEAASSVGQAFSDATETVAGHLQDGAEALGLRRGTDVESLARESFQPDEPGSAAPSLLSEWTTAAADLAFEAGDRLSDMIESYPLAAGGLAVLTGAVLALSLPATAQEDALLGSTRDTLKGRATDAGYQALSRLEDAAGRAATAAIDQARDAASEMLDGTAETH